MEDELDSDDEEVDGGEYSLPSRGTIGEESDINFQKKAIENATGPFQFRLVHFKHIEELIMFYLSYCH